MPSMTLMVLPGEILQSILTNLGPDDLLRLGEVNHYLNHLALEAFLGLKHGGTYLDRFPPPLPYLPYQMYRGLSMALGLNHITEIDQTISGDIGQALRQVRMLELGMRGLRTIRIFILRININRPSANSGTKEIWGRTDQSGVKFMEGLHRLMDLVVARGCNKVFYQGFHVPGCKLSSSQIRHLSEQTIGVKVWRWMKSLVLRTKPCALPQLTPAAGKHISPAKRPALKTCILGGLTFLGPMSISFNLDFLRRNATTITFLELYIAHLTRDKLKTQGLLCSLLDNINLPNLKIFVITTQVSLIPTPSLTRFLSRHPTLVRINLTSLPYPPGQPVMRSTNCPLIRLTYLKELVLPARVAAWLFASMAEMPPTFQRVKLDACTLPDNVTSLGNALEKLRQGVKRVDTLSLNAEWWDVDWQSLRNRHNNSSVPDMSKFSVGELILVVCRWPSELTAVASMLLDMLIYLMNFFSSVESLDIQFLNTSDEFLESRTELEEELKAMIKDAFASLKFVQY